jgi:phage shock protein A
MGFKNRINALLKSQFNYWVTLAEDPEKMMNQAVQEMEDGLKKERARLAAIKFRVNERDRLLQRICKQISFWQGRAEEFIRDNMDENARDALRKRRILDEEERKLKTKREEDELKLKEMETFLSELESRVQMAKAKRNVLIKDIRLRKGVSEAKREVEECRAIDFEEPFSLLRKMEERLEEEREFNYLKHGKEKEILEKEEKLIDEEIHKIRKAIREK